MSSFKERKIAKKKEEILRAAAEVFIEKGYHGTTMEEIAARLLMTKGSMYYYFKNILNTLQRNSRIFKATRELLVGVKQTRRKFELALK